MMTTMAALFGGLPLALGHGRRFRAAPSARHHHRGRPDRQPGPDALHDAGRLSVLRPPGRTRCSVAREVSPWVSTLPEPVHGGLTGESFRSLHQASGRDYAADRGAGALAASWRSRCLPRVAAARSGFPTIQVHAGLPGASPETMASAVATPLERQFGRIAGITEMTSSSQLEQHDDHAAIRSEPEHRCGRAAKCRPPSMRPRPVARRHAEQPRLSANRIPRTRRS